MSKLTGKVAVVTGASKGIGAAIAKALAAEGASVVVNYASSKSGADAVVDAIAKAGGQAVAIGGDVSKEADAQGIIDAAINHFGRLDVLVNNSGVYAFSPIEEITPEHVDVTKAAVKHLDEGGSIINIGSVVSRITPPASAVYTGTKGAVDAITGVLARELGPRKIRVNALNPGMVETEGTAAGGFTAPEGEMVKWAVAQTPLGRLGHPQDIASIAVFLASESQMGGGGWKKSVEVKPLGKADLEKIAHASVPGDVTGLGTNEAALFHVAKGWKAGGFESKTGYVFISLFGPLEVHKDGE